MNAIDPKLETDPPEDDEEFGEAFVGEREYEAESIADEAIEELDAIAKKLAMFDNLYLNAGAPAWADWKVDAFNKLVKNVNDARPQAKILKENS